MAASVSFDETCRVLGIPHEIQRSYELRGLKNLYAWQVECLNETGALRGNNVVYCAPTGGGKTLVAELVLLKTACALRKKCIFILPYVSLVVEKHKDIKRLLTIYNRSKPKHERISVRSFHGESNFSRKLQEDVLICTIEKANAVINALVSRGQIFQLGCVIIDEMHVLGDISRGYNLEILVSKLKYLQLKASSKAKRLNFQIIALSATISNLPFLSKWLNAILYQTSFRPIPLKEMIVSGGTVFDMTDATEIRSLVCLSNFSQIKQRMSTLSEEMHHILSLCLEALQSSQQVIVFCTSRNQCQTTANLLTDFLTEMNIVNIGDEDASLFEDRMIAVEKIHRASVSLEAKMMSDSSVNGIQSPQSILKKTIFSGIAFHHAGLSSTERDIIEKLFRKGTVKILTATSTLAAGVNLPAGRVIIRSIYFGRELISPVQYRQMCGRAGRAGLTKFGESFVLTRHNVFERDKAMRLSTAPIPNIVSQMNPWNDNGKALLKVFLELVSLGVCVDRKDIHEYTEQTLFFTEVMSKESDHLSNNAGQACTNSSTISISRLEVEVDDLIVFLSSAKAVEQDHHIPTYMDNNEASSSARLRVTRFGRAVMESNMNLDEALLIYEDFLLARSRGLSLVTNLHLIYLVTPLSHALVPFFGQLCKVLENARRTGQDEIVSIFEAVGIGSREEATMLKWTNQPPGYSTLFNATDRMRKYKIERELNINAKDNCNTSGSEYECNLICKCNRVWAASCLNMLVDCGSYADVTKAYSSQNKQLTVSDVQNLLQSTSILCHRLTKFCREIGWPDFERLVEHVNTNLLSIDLSAEHRTLLSIPGISPNLAKTFVSNGVLSIRDVADAEVDDLVQCVQLDVRFEMTDKADLYLAKSGFVSENTGTVSTSDSKDESRRKRLIGFMRNLVDTARQMLLEKGCADADETSTTFDISDSESDDQSCSVGGDNEQGEINFDNPIVEDTQEDELESSMEEERCGFMYEQVNWLADEGAMKHRLESGAKTEKVPPFTRNPESPSCMYDTTCVPVLSNMNDSTTVDERMLTRKETCVHLNHEQTITDDAFMELFDIVESVDTTKMNSVAETSSALEVSHAVPEKLREDQHVKPTIVTPHNSVLKGKTPHSSLSKNSPYLFPFTPSKRLSPGRYMYLPQLSESVEPNSAQDAIKRQSLESSIDISTQESFDWVNLKDYNGCEKFLHQLRSCRAVAFDLLYTSIPISTFILSTSQRKAENIDHISLSSIMTAWSPLVAWRPSSCLLPPNMTCNERIKLKDPKEAKVLTGISFNFGNKTGFYLPLPTLPPLLSPPDGSELPKDRTSRCFSSSIDLLSQKAQLLICLYVGFDLFFEKCPRLLECLKTKMKSVESKLFEPSRQPKSSSQNSGNPLLAVSKLWAARARYALRLEWLAGKSIEWRLCNEIMNSERITKISVDIKGKIFSLRERDVLVKGYVEDPQLAFYFLGSDLRGAVENNSAQFILPLPPVVKLRRGLMVNVDIVKACHVAVATMHVMAEKENELKAVNLFETFINIEMPLCITVADAERNGMPFKSDFFTELRQDLHDRNKMIEYFCKSFDTNKGQEHNFNFDPSSLKDVHRIKEIFSNLLTSQAIAAFNRYKSVDVNGDKRSSSQWSCGKGDGGVILQWASQEKSGKQEELIKELVDKLLSCHPVLMLIKEYRSHVRFLPLLQSILNHRFRPHNGIQLAAPEYYELDRVRGDFKTLGTETGRLIVATPPLQQIPHLCVYSKPERVSLSDELNDARTRGEQEYRKMVQAINETKPVKRQWVRMTSLSSNKGISVTSDNKATNMYDSSDVLTNYLPSTSSGRLVCVLDRNMLQSVQCPITKKSLNLYRIWQDAGFIYSEEDACKISVVIIDIKNHHYFYPADQVVRLLAPLLPNVREAQSLRTASLTLTQLQSQSQTQRHSGAGDGNVWNEDPMLFMLSKQLNGEPISEMHFENFWRRDYLELSDRCEINPRDGFCASKGYVLMASDYAQVELRILAHFSLDDNLCAAFRNRDSEDIFKCIASTWHGISVSDVSAEQRNRVKQLSYAVLYGAGPGKVASDANCSLSEAELLMNQFLNMYPGIKSFMQEVKKSCAQLGYVQTMLGRRRYLPHIKHSQRKERSRAERQAVNTVCQGSAADLIKLAMINIHHTFQQVFNGRNYHARRSVPGGGLYMVLDAVRPVLQIHDELVFEVQEKYVHTVAGHIRHCMESAVELNVPLKVKISVGHSFGSLEPLAADSSSTTSCISQGYQPCFHENENSISNSESSNNHSLNGLANPVLSGDTFQRQNRRKSGNLQPHPLLAISSTEQLERSAQKGNAEVVADDMSKKPFTDHAKPQQLPLARRIFGKD